ncbi:MAG: UPF0280 family protein [Desulfobulbus sp.]|jgi:ApbE superfamily uncharacterized protein (UPF0280 family)|nr:UPF0280 family protein [Desulfobulbus sp.]
MRVYRSFSWKNTNLRVACEAFDLVTRTVVEERRQLERYIARHPAFLCALEPLPLLDDPPEAARRMTAAAELTGLGPMAAVAGTLAQLGVEAALVSGCAEAIVENGGDIFLFAALPVTIAIHTGGAAIGSRLALRIEPHQTPLALCSSSSTMGHSLSLGRCDLATVVSRNAALADAAATLVGNLVLREGDLTSVLEQVGAIPGIDGILAVKNGRIGLWGQLPQLVRNEDAATGSKITRDSGAS